MIDDVITLVLNEDGVAEVYDDTYDVTIHCVSEEEQKKTIEALEKQIPKKVVNIDDFADYAECPSCGAIATDHLGCLYGWCRKCGQKLKRSEEE